VNGLWKNAQKSALVQHRAPRAASLAASVQPPSCAAPPPRRRPATYAQPAQITPFSAPSCPASASLEQTRSGPPQPTHAQTCRAVPHLHTGSTCKAHKAHWRSARQLRLRRRNGAGAQQRGGAVQQCANRPSRRLEAGGRRRGERGCGGGWWLAEVAAQGGGALGARQARAKRRCGRCAAKGRAGCAPVGAVETGVAESEEVEYDSNEEEARAGVGADAQSGGAAPRVCRRGTIRSCGYFAAGSSLGGV